MRKNDHIIKQYLKEVSAELNCPKSVKSVYASELRNDILNYFSNNDSVSIDDLYDNFGTPESIADGFFDKSDYKRLLKKAKKKSLYWKLVVVGLVIICIAIIFLLICIVQNSAGNITVTNSYYT